MNISPSRVPGIPGVLFGFAAVAVGLCVGAVYEWGACRAWLCASCWGLGRPRPCPLGTRGPVRRWRHRAGHFQSRLMSTVIMDTQVLGGP